MKKSPHRGRVALWMLWGLALGAALGVALWLGSGDETPPAPGTSGTSGTSPVVEIAGVRSFKVRDGGRLVWELSARRISVGADRTIVTAEGVQHGVYYRDGKPFLRWQAQRLRLNQLRRDIEADGQVSATGPDGFSLRATRARWSHQKQELRCDVPVHATLRGATFDAPSLIYEAKTGRLRCPHTAKAVTKDLTVDASDVTYDTRSGLLHCASATRAALNGFTVSGGDVTYQTRTGLLRCGSATRAVANGFTVSGGGVSYETRTGLLRCARGVRVEASGATLRGGHALVDTRARRVSLDGGVEIRVRPGAQWPRNPLGQNLPGLAAVP